MKLTLALIALCFAAMGAEPAKDLNYTPVSPLMSVRLSMPYHGYDPSCDPCQSCESLIDVMMCGLGWSYTCYVACPICPSESDIMMRSLPVKTKELVLSPMQLAGVQ